MHALLRATRPALLGGSFITAASFAQPPKSSHAAKQKPNFVKDVAQTEFFSLSTRDLEGNTFPFTRLQNKVILILNIFATSDQTLSNYNDLKYLQAKYASRGLEILTFFIVPPTLRDAASPAAICKLHGKGNTAFHIMEKTNVNPDENSLCSLLKTGGQQAHWNLHSKFLVACGGERCTISIFDGVMPKALTEDIEDAIGKLAK